MNKTSLWKKALAVVLVFMMVLPIISLNAYMVDDSAYKAAMTSARSYIDGLTVNSSTNVPSTVVSNFGTQFSWDNEKRESNNKSYLFEWSYYNGVVFEGLQYLYEASKDSTYLNYVSDYMSAMITSTGGWAKTTNNSSKDAAGYVATHGADCYKTASLLMDLALKSDGTIDTTSKYYKMATTIYADLTTGTGSNYCTDSALGGNYWHSWLNGSAPTYKVWLDGIYMIQPFLAEYAYYTNDTDQLNTIVDRFAWIYTNMRESGTGLYYHAANSSTSYVDYHWTRSIGWYAMAIVDVMQYMSGDNLATMKSILKDLVDNMLPYQDSATGMWANLCDKSISSTNKLETSGTSMLAYTMTKAVNNGWLDSSYLEYAKNAFTGMTENKLSGSSLSDIYFKASANGSNNYETSSYYYSNEGKGVGPYIMAYAELLKAEEKETETEETVNQVYTVNVAIPDKQVTTSTGTGTSTGEKQYVLTDTIEAGKKYVVVTNGYAFTESNVSEAFKSPSATAVTVSGNIVTGNIDDTMLWTFSESGSPSTGFTTQMSSVASTHKIVLNLNSGYFIRFQTVDANNENGSDYNTDLIIKDNKIYVTKDLDSFWHEGVEKPAGTYNASIILDGTTFTSSLFSSSDFSFYAETTATSDSSTTTTTTVAVESIDDITLDVEKGSTIDLSSRTFTVHYEDGTQSTMEIPSDLLSATGYTTDKLGTITFNVVNSNTGNQVGKIVATVKNDATTDPVDPDPIVPDEGGDYDNLSWTYIEGTKLTPVTIYVKYKGTLQDNKSYLLGYTADYKGAIINSSGQAASVTTVDSKNATYYDANGNAYTSTEAFIVDTDGSLAKNLYTKGNSQLYNSSTGKYLTASSSGLGTGNTGTTFNFGDNKISFSVTSGWLWWSTTQTYYLYANSTPTVGVSDSQSNTIYGYEPVTVYEKTGSSDGGYYALAKKFTYNASLGADFDMNSIKQQTEIVYSATGSANDVQVIDWTDSKVTYSFDKTLNTSVAGVYTMSVMYDGTKIGTVAVNVAENDYPDYPNKGAVSIDKSATGNHFTDTGVADVELTVKGTAVTSSIDVIFITDVSNSMAWEAGTTTFNTANSKMMNLQTAVAGFADSFLSDTSGLLSNNTISIATFGGIDRDYLSGTLDGYTDPTRTLLVASDSKTEVANTINGITYNVDSSKNVYLTFDGTTSTDAADQNYGNTNYDYAFMETSKVIETLKSSYLARTGVNYDDSGRQIQVVMLTDGAPTNYEGGYYNSRMSTERPDGIAQWINASGNLATYTNTNLTTQANWYSYISTTRLTWATKVYNTSSVAGISAIGFDLANGGFSNWTFTEASSYPLTPVLANMVDGGTVDVSTADDATTLAETLREKAESLKKSSTGGYVIDKMGAQYDLQMASTVTCNIVDSGKINLSDFSITPKIQVMSYEVYSRDEIGLTINGVKVTYDMIGQRKGTDPTVYETVTFNADGTEAYSDQLEGNIMMNGVIYAKHFTYNTNKSSVQLTDGTTLDAETFNWKIGNIPEDEIVLKYNVYLTDSMEGARDAGVYNTNESAILYYVNFLNHDCELEFPIPSLEWKKARVSYELYLVNTKGEPIDSNGNVVSFENRVLMSNLIDVEKYLNTRTLIDIETLESILPESYGLFNPDSTYTVTIGSGTGMSSAKIVDNKFATTKVFSPTGGTVGTDGTVTLSDYTDTMVAFAVCKLEIHPDVVVVDYGKTIHVSTISNDFGAYRTVGIGDIDSVGTAIAKTYKTSGGTFNVIGRDVSFTPTKYLSSLQKVKYSVSAKTERYPVTYPLSSTLTVIPATTVYYEDNFGGEESDGGLYIQYTGDWYTASDDGTEVSGVTANTDTTDTQDDGHIGEGHTPYGYDSSYDDDVKFSNGSAAKVTGTVSKVDGKPVYNATAEFTFTGTGFDIISRTDLDCGMISITITDANGTVKTVPVINKGVNTLYQIPVISYTGIPYGTYTVKINVCAPVSILKINGAVFYLDAIRIYDPMGTSSSENAEFDEANSAYDTDKEANAFVSSIRDYIIQAGKLDTSETYGAVYVDTLNNQYTEDGLLEQDVIKDFELVGPNEEVYLSPGYGVGFILESSRIPSSVQLEMKVPAPLNNGASLSAQTYGKSNIVNFAVNSATEMFYDITNAIEFTQTTNDSGETVYRATVILANGLPTENLGEIVSITNVKMTYPNGVQAVSEDEITTNSVTDDNVVTCALKANWDTYVDVFGTVKTQHEASIPTEYITSAESLNTVKNGGTAKAVVTTSRYVDSLTLKDSYGKDVEIANVTSSVDESKILTEDYKEAKTWTFEFTAHGATGTSEYTVETSDGVSQSFGVEIKNPEVTAIKVATMPTKTVYGKGETFNSAGMTLKVTYSDGTEKIVKDGFSTDGGKLTKTGTNTVTVRYGGKVTTVKVTVRSAFVQAIYSFFGKLFGRK